MCLKFQVRCNNPKYQVKFCLIHSASGICRKLQNWPGFSTRVYESGPNLRFINRASQGCFCLELQNKCFAHFFVYTSSKLPLSAVFMFCSFKMMELPILGRIFSLMLWVALCLSPLTLKVYVEVLTPRTSECETGDRVYGDNKRIIKMRSLVVCCCCSVTQSCLTLCNPARLPCPSSPPRVC